MGNAKGNPGEKTHGPVRPRFERALVVGRFQPPHQGHLKVFEAAAGAARETIAVVGSAQRSHTRRNPFTAGERVEALRGMLQDAGLEAAYVVPVVDLDQYHLWVTHVKAHVPAFDVVVASDPMTLYLFSRAGHSTLKVEPEDRGRLSGTAIRERLFEGRDVSEEVTKSVSRLLSREDIRARLTAISTK